MCVFLASVVGSAHTGQGNKGAVSYTHVYLECRLTFCAACS